MMAKAGFEREIAAVALRAATPRWRNAVSDAMIDATLLVGSRSGCATLAELCARNRHSDRVRQSSQRAARGRDSWLMRAAS